jgi:hypothetical protein
MRLAAHDPGPGEPWLGVVVGWDALPRFLETLGSVRPWMIADAQLRRDGEDVLVIFPGWVWADRRAESSKGGGGRDR